MKKLFKYIHKIGLRDWLTILALIIGPILAVQVGTYQQQCHESRQHKEKIFEILMATRMPFTSRTLDQVTALNQIDIEFYGHQDVLNSWHLYLHHLSTSPTMAGDWGNKEHDLLVELLINMSNDLGYKFDYVFLNQSSYLPAGFSKTKTTEQNIQLHLESILMGKEAFPVKITKLNVSNPHK